MSFYGWSAEAHATSEAPPPWATQTATVGPPWSTSSSTKDTTGQSRCMYGCLGKCRDPSHDNSRSSYINKQPHFVCRCINTCQDVSKCVNKRQVDPSTGNFMRPHANYDHSNGNRNYYSPSTLSRNSNTSKQPDFICRCINTCQDLSKCANRRRADEFTGNFVPTYVSQDYNNSDVTSNSGQQSGRGVGISSYTNDFSSTSVSVKPALPSVANKTSIPPYFSYDSSKRTCIDTAGKLKAFLPTLSKLRASTSTDQIPELVCDCEGNNLGTPGGTLTIIQIYVVSLRHTYVFDVKTLGAAFFQLKNSQGNSVANILSSREYSQLWWDVRGDQYSLNHLFGIKLGRCIDAQLVEVAFRDSEDDDGDKSRLISLVDCIRKYGSAFMSGWEKGEWVAAKVDGSTYFKDHSYGVFDSRPLPALAWEYAAGDVENLVELFNHMWPKLSVRAKRVVQEESDNRVSGARNGPGGGSNAPRSLDF